MGGKIDEDSIDGTFPLVMPTDFTFGRTFGETLGLEPKAAVVIGDRDDETEGLPDNDDGDGNGPDSGDDDKMGNASAFGEAAGYKIGVTVASL